MLEINEENLIEVQKLREKDIKIRDKWVVGAHTSNATCRLPKGHEERQKFINDWLSVCPSLTNIKIKEYENELKKIAIKRKVELPDWKLSVLVARKVAMIKKKYAYDQWDLVVRTAKKYNKKNIGCTYLKEIVIILDAHLDDSIKDFPVLISNYEGQLKR